METLPQISIINCLIEHNPNGSQDPGMIVRFPVRYMLAIDMEGLAKIRQFSRDFYGGYIDFNEIHPALIENRVIVVNSLQEALETMYGDVPFIDYCLN